MPAKNRAEDASTKVSTKSELHVIWHAFSREEVLKKLDSGLDEGLSKTKAKERLEQYGFNELEEGKKTTFLQMVIEQLNSFVVIKLIVASIISAFLGESVDAIAIILIVILNTIMASCRIHAHKKNWMR
jgi:Ca2+-transporting ATPase